MKFVKIAAALFFTFCFSIIQFDGVAFAEGDSVGGTILPETSKSVRDCTDIMNEVSKNSCAAKTKIFKKDTVEAGKCSSAVKPNFLYKDKNGDSTGQIFTESDVLGCGIKTGTIKLWMVPYYIRYILQFIIGISGLVAVGGIVYGGYLYLFAGVSSEKDQGKKAIQYGLIGMVMTLVAWAFVNIIISLVTG